MAIIYFFGPDRTGKSTLVKTLAEKLRTKNCNVKLSWMRGSHTFVFIVATLLSKFDSFKGSDNPYYNIKLPNKLKRFWQFLEFVSAIPVILSEFLIPSLLRSCVLADRYAMDLVVWICITTRDYRFLKTFEAKVLLTLAKRVDTKFYITANCDELVRRSGDDLWFPKEQLFLYGKLAKAIDAYVIDTTNKPVEECLQEVLTVVSKKI